MALLDVPARVTDKLERNLRGKMGVANVQDAMLICSQLIPPHQSDTIVGQDT
jgi:hypothetical protein